MHPHPTGHSRSPGQGDTAPHCHVRCGAVGHVCAALLTGRESDAGSAEVSVETRPEKHCDFVHDTGVGVVDSTSACACQCDSGAGLPQVRDSAYCGGRFGESSDLSWGNSAIMVDGEPSLAATLLSSPACTTGASGHTLGNC